MTAEAAHTSNCPLPISNCSQHWQTITTFASKAQKAGSKGREAGGEITFVAAREWESAGLFPGVPQPQLALSAADKRKSSFLDTAAKLCTCVAEVTLKQDVGEDC